MFYIFFKMNLKVIMIKIIKNQLTTNIIFIFQLFFHTPTFYFCKQFIKKLFFINIKYIIFASTYIN
jgi:hypothetical protein